LKAEALIALFGGLSLSRQATEQMNRLRCRNIQVSAVTDFWCFPQFLHANGTTKFKAGPIFVHSLSVTVMHLLDPV
jgi:hypothetical protein